MTTSTTPAKQGYRWVGGYREAAAYLGCTERQLRRWTQQGRVEHNRMANAVRFSKEGIDRFVEDSTVGAPREHTRRAPQRQRQHNGWG